MSATTRHRLAPMSLGVSLVHFGLPALGLFAVTRWGIPAFVSAGVAPMAAWYLAGLAVFAPLLALALSRARHESGTEPGAIAQRLWLRRPSRAELLEAGLGLVGVFVASGAVFGAMALGARELGVPAPSPLPPFLAGLDLERGTGSAPLMALWVPFFCCNILGEELFWRGYILPRQELAFGRHAWALNAALWAVFHLAFGGPLLVLLVPLLVALPWLVQRRRNLWLGVLLHGVYNGIPSLLIASGLIR